MSTNNFYKKNASKIFAICESNANIDITDAIDNISFEIKEKIINTNYGFERRSVRSVNELRSYESTYICSVYIYRVIADVYCIVQVNCFARSGYYNGACLDYEFAHVIGCSNFDEINEAKELFCDEADRHCYYNYGMAKIQSKNCDKWMKKELKNIIGIVESVYENCATSKLRTVAILSNGEAVYEKI